MNREDTVSLLKEIMGTCPSFCEAQAVSIMEEKSGWALSVFWVPRSSDGDCLGKIVAKRNLDVAASNGRTVFRSSMKSF
jgi:hypothetical protein